MRWGVVDGVGREAWEVRERGCRGGGGGGGRGRGTAVPVAGEDEGGRDGGAALTEEEVVD